MKVVIPPSDVEYPDNVQKVLFKAPEGMEDSIQECPAVAHIDAEGNMVAAEILLELTPEEISVLKHEPYLTLILMTNAMVPFQLQTSYPPDEKYKKIDEHHHLCISNLTHEKNFFWRCDNPRHHANIDRVRECEECWAKRTGQVDASVV